MTNFVKALTDKLSDLQEEREALEIQFETDLSRIDAKAEAVQELLQDEGTPAPPTKKSRGRPKGSKGSKGAKAKKTSEVNPEILEDYEAAVRELGENATTPEEQKKMVGRFRPTPRPQQSPARNIKTGTREEVSGAGKDSNKRISVEDDE